MTILRAQVESNKRGLCHCGQRATSELSYAEEMDQRQDASLPSLPPSSPPTDQLYRTPPVEETSHLVPIPEDVQLPSPTSSEEVAVPIPPPRATSPGRVVSGQHCWTHCKVDLSPGSGASSRFFWHSSGLQGKDRARPYPSGHGEAGVRTRDSVALCAVPWCFFASSAVWLEVRIAQPIFKRLVGRIFNGLNWSGRWVRSQCERRS